MMTDDQRAGYSIIDFRMVDGKAVTEFKGYTAARDDYMKIAWKLTAIRRHVETPDGKPLSHYLYISEHFERTDTIGEDGKVASRTTDYPATQPAREETSALPEGATLWHGHYFLLKSKGTKEGTEYTHKIFGGPQTPLVRAKVGPRRKVSVNGREMELLELTHTWVKPPEGVDKEVQWKEVIYFDDNFIPRRVEAKMTGAPKTTMIACSKEQAMKLPESIPGESTSESKDE